MPYPVQATVPGVVLTNILTAMENLREILGEQKDI